MAQKKKKQPRRRYSDELKAVAVARAQLVGPIQAGRELGVEGNIVAMWAKRAGVKVASFRGARISDAALAAAGPPPSLSEAQIDHPRSAPDTWSRKSKWPHEERLALVRETFVVGARQGEVARRHGVPSNTLSNWVHRYRDEAKASGNPVPRQVEVTPPPTHRVEDDIREALSSTGTQLSRPEPSETLALDKPRRGRPPRSSRAEQLPLYQEPQRATATPHYDEAERAREQAQSELKDELLRQALKEREAFKTVMEIMMREKNER